MTQGRAVGEEHDLGGRELLSGWSSRAPATDPNYYGASYTVPLARSQARLALIASASVVLAACGSAGPPSGQRTPVGAGEREGADADAPRAAAEGYFSAVHSSDGVRACDSLTRGLRVGIERLQGVSCDQALEDEAKRQPDALAGYRVAQVAVSGSKATATLDGGGFEDRLTLVRVAGRWLISDAPGLGG